MAKENKSQAEQKSDINSMSIEQFRKAYPAIYQKILADPLLARSIPLSDGFFLDSNDPYAGGVLRTYAKLTGKEGLKLPFVIDWKDAALKAAIENYILRAQGACDTARAQEANKALAKIQPKQ